MDSAVRLTGRFLIRYARVRDATAKYAATVALGVVPLDGGAPFDLILPASAPVPDVVGVYDISVRLIRFGARNGYLYMFADEFSCKPVVE